MWHYYPFGKIATTITYKKIPFILTKKIRIYLKVHIILFKLSLWLLIKKKMEIIEFFGWNKQLTLFCKRLTSILYSLWQFSTGKCTIYKYIIPSFDSEKKPNHVNWNWLLPFRIRSDWISLIINWIIHLWILQKTLIICL